MYLIRLKIPVKKAKRPEAIPDSPVTIRMGEVLGLIPTSSPITCWDKPAKPAEKRKNATKATPKPTDHLPRRVLGIKSIFMCFCRVNVSVVKITTLPEATLLWRLQCFFFYPA